MRYYKTIFITWAIGVLGFAQSADSLSVLSPIEVSANPHFRTGHSVEIFSIKDAQTDPSTYLTDLLENKAGLQFKKYGNGMLAGITYRGLSSAHTALYWQDIPLNSTLNGQVDYNLLSSSLFESVEFRKGGGSALLGSGNVGGSLVLENARNYPEHWSGKLQQTLGSFGLSQSHAQLHYSSSNLQMSIRGLNYQLKNDYEVPTLNGPQKQENARIKSPQILADFTFTPKPHQKLSVAYWQSKSKRELPGTFYAPSSSQLQEDETHRLSVKYSLQKKHIKHSLQGAYTDETYQYFYDAQQAEPSKSEAQNYMAQYQTQITLPKHWQLMGKLYGQKSIGNSENFGHPHQNNLWLSLSIAKEISPSWKSNINIQKGFSNAFTIPFTIDAGLEFLWTSEHTFFTHFSTNYRNPTFNDLYWQPGGNTELKPENGWMSDLGYRFQSSNQQWKWETQLYYSHFQDWIQWTPTSSGLWKVENLAHVDGYGWENMLSFSQKFLNWKIQAQARFRLNISENQYTGFQLSYVPQQSGSILIDLQYKSLYLSYNQQFTGKRFTVSDESDSLDSFEVAQLSLAWDLSLAKFPLQFSISVKNLFNQEIQGVKGYYLAPRNYITSLIIPF